MASWIQGKPSPLAHIADVIFWFLRARKLQAKLFPSNNIQIGVMRVHLSRIASLLFQTVLYSGPWNISVNK